MRSFIHRVAYGLAVAVNVGCFAHVIAEYVAEVTLVCICMLIVTFSTSKIESLEL